MELKIRKNIHTLQQRQLQRLVLGIKGAAQVIKGAAKVIKRAAEVIKRAAKVIKGAAWL